MYTLLQKNITVQVLPSHWYQTCTVFRPKNYQPFTLAMPVFVVIHDIRQGSTVYRLRKISAMRGTTEK